MPQTLLDLDIDRVSARPAYYRTRLNLAVDWINVSRAGRYDCALLAGATDRTPSPTSVSIAAFGAVRHGKMVRRSTAKPGDLIIVTGTIGDAALGVLLRRDQNLGKRWRLSEAMGAHLKQRYLLPEPRNALAHAVLQNASAAIDVSDGLAGDLAKLCRASAVAAEIDVARVPLSDAVRAALAADPAVMETALSGGDDYEIVLTLAADKFAALRTAAHQAGVAVTEIGSIAAGEGARFVHAGKTLNFARPSYSHF
jgi:thiamine-monophosphate kinase